MSEETRDGFKFRSGQNALDLTATVSGRKRNAFIDALQSPEDLDRWLHAASFAKVSAGQDDLELARSLREAIYRLAMDRVSAHPLSEDARLTLNTIAEGQPAFLSLNEAGGTTTLGTASQLLASVAREAISLIGTEKAGRLRQCEAGNCAVLFLDESRRGDRRWCSMAFCGNRAKVKAFRARSADGSDS